MSIATVTSWIGTGSMVAGGLAVVALFLALASYATGLYGYRLWRNVTAIYKFSAIQYWFKRMEANGTHVLRKEHDEKLAAKEAA